MFLNNKSKLLRRSEDNKYDYIIYISDKEECDAIDKGSIETPYEIIAYGDVISMNKFLAEKVLPEAIFINNVLTKSLINSYKCWACEELGIDQRIGHISVIDSWLCLANILGNPEYVVIIQKLVEDVKTEAI